MIVYNNFMTIVKSIMKKDIINHGTTCLDIRSIKMEKYGLFLLDISRYHLSLSLSPYQPLKFDTA